MLLFGPRQTGKSTLCRQVFADLPQARQLLYSLDNPADLLDLESDQRLIGRQVDGLLGHLRERVYVWIDEIQRLPSLLDGLQYLIDQDQIVLLACGSSARKMRQQATNWLPGRVHREHLPPLTWHEAGLAQAPERLNKHLLWGFLPGIVSQNDIDRRGDTIE